MVTSSRAARGKAATKSWSAGWIDRAPEVGKHAWRLVKSGTLGFSYGYLPLAAAPRRPGGRHITELDVFEITATPVPMNADARVLGWKSAWDEGDRRASSDELRDRAEEIEHEFSSVLIARFDC